MPDLKNILVFNGYALVGTIKESAGKFELPDSASSKPQKGKVIAISKTLDISEMGTVYRCPTVIGQIIYFRNWGSETIDFGGQDFVFVRFRDIIGGEK